MLSRTERGRPMTRWFACLLLTSTIAGCATAAFEPTPAVRLVGAWFTNVQTVPGQAYTLARPEYVYPETKRFTRQRDSRVMMVIVFPDGDPHSLRAILKDSSAAQRRPVEWSVGPVARASAGGWRSATVWWSTERLSPGTYTVDLAIDSKDAGSYAFDLE